MKHAILMTIPLLLALSGAAATDPTKGFSGTVAETMSTDQYTYMNVDAGDRKVWVAGPKMPVKVGDEVTIPPGGLAMGNFESPTFNRKFDEIFFIGQARLGKMPGVSKEGAAAEGTGLPAGHPPLTGGNALPGMAPKAGGTPVYAETLPEGAAMELGDAIAKAEELKGKVVVVQGVVSKVNAGIMGRNWIHIQTIKDGKVLHDLTVTTADLPALKDVVTVAGTVDTKADFGSGYKFDVMLKDARVKLTTPPAAPAKAP